MSQFQSTKLIELGSAAFRQWRADHSHCRFVHGYQLMAKFWFGSKTLDDKNWVVDFAGLKELKAHLQSKFDHFLCVAQDDPALEVFKQLEQAGACKLTIFEKGVGIERTAEYCYEVADKMVREMTNNRCWVDQVEVFEHQANSATYTPTKEQKEQNSTIFEVREEAIRAAERYDALQSAMLQTPTENFVPASQAVNTSLNVAFPTESQVLAAKEEVLIDKQKDDNKINDLREQALAQATDQQTAPQPHQRSVPAHVGPNNSQGKGDWFKGTTWGN